jgi:Na+/H+ antiporter NhaC
VKTTMNWGRVILGGGLAAGVLMVLGALLTALFFDRQELRSAMQALKPPRSGAVAPFLFFAFAYLFLGLLIAWGYAALRPRFGPGPQTAVIAGVAVWLAANPLQSLLIGRIAQLPAGFVLRSMAAYLVMILSASLVGAWAYRE